jgi:hypothetical protein
MELEHRAIGRRRAVEGDLFTDGLGGTRHVLVARSGDHESWIRHRQVRPGLARLGRPVFEGRQADLAQVALGGEAVHEKPVADLARHLGHQLAHGGQQDLRVAVGVRARIEKGSHEGVGVELAAELELLAGRPGGPDRPHGRDELAHARGRVRPGHGEALGDVGFDLAPQAEDEPPLRQELEIVGQDSQVHGVAGESDRDARPELEPLGRRRTDGDGKERVVRRLRRPDAVVPVCLCLAGRLGDPCRIEPEALVDLHRPTPFIALPPFPTALRLAGTPRAPPRSRRRRGPRRPPWHCPRRRRCSPRACAPWPDARCCRR